MLRSFEGKIFSHRKFRGQRNTGCISRTMDFLWGKRFRQNRVNPYAYPPKGVVFIISPLKRLFRSSSSLHYHQFVNALCSFLCDPIYNYNRVTFQKQFHFLCSAKLNDLSLYDVGISEKFSSIAHSPVETAKANSIELYEYTAILSTYISFTNT